jgi:catechol 2,3-dioxygenase-like lactoylglutathione lyase family enzyme
MKMEHVALNVSDPLAMAAWYRDHLDFQVVKAMSDPPFTHFLREAAGTMMIEIYKNPPNEVPPYPSMNPLLLHLAFVSADPEKDKERLLSAGATLVEETRLADGTHLVMLRDPWGLAIQLAKRALPMLGQGA